LSDTVQHLARDSIVLHDGIPISKTAQFPLDHKRPDSFGGFVQQGRSPIFPLQAVRSGIGSAQSGIQRSQPREGVLDLAPQVSQRSSLLLGDLVVKHTQSGF